MQSSAMVHRPLTFDPPTSMLGQVISIRNPNRILNTTQSNRNSSTLIFQLPIQSRTGSIGSLSLPSVFESRPVVSTSQVRKKESKIDFCAALEPLLKIIQKTKKKTLQIKIGVRTGTVRRSSSPRDARCA